MRVRALLIRAWSVKLLIVLLSGCSNLRPADGRGAEVAEYYRGPIGITLFPEGGARVVLSARGDGKSQTFLLPASPAEVGNLLKVISTIDESVVAGSTSTPGGKQSPDGSYFLCRHGDHIRILRLGSWRRRSSDVVDGIAREFESVGLYNLVDAISENQTADGYFVKGDLRDAARHYNLSVREFIDWEGAFFARCATQHREIYEPPVVEVDAFTGYPIELTLGAVENARREFADDPNGKEKIAVAALQRTWREMTKGVATEKEGEATVVSFPSINGKRFDSDLSAVPSFIQDSLLRKMLAESGAGSKAATADRGRK